jgi:hypothetical protein
VNSLLVLAEPHTVELVLQPDPNVFLAIQLINQVSLSQFPKTRQQTDQVQFLSVPSANTKLNIFPDFD